MRTVVFVTFTIVSLILGCNGDSGDTEVTCESAFQGYCDECYPPDTPPECYNWMLEEVSCNEMDCDYPDSFIECVDQAPCSGEFDSCFDEYEESLLGSLSDTCENYCSKCDDCVEQFPDFHTETCGPGSDQEESGLSCTEYCEGDKDLLESLNQLGRPVAEYSCCEFVWAM